MSEIIRIPWAGWKAVRTIGKGTFGTVYEIERNLFDITEKAAMKVIMIPGDESVYDNLLLSIGYDYEAVNQTLKNELKKAQKEYLIMSELKGITNIVSCEDFFYEERDDGKGFIVYMRMELLKSLHEVIHDHRKQGVRFVDDEIIKIGKDICQALMVCEQRGLIHRDIKPSNILVSKYGDYKLGDFGTARDMDHTTQATYAGTVSFMAPEVFRREKYGTTVDTYSLGLVLYWLSNMFRMPFLPIDEVPDSDAIRLAENRRINGETLPAPCNAASGLAAVILKACSYNCKGRYQTASEMLSDLELIGRREDPSVNPEAESAVKTPAESYCVDELSSEIETDFDETNKIDSASEYTRGKYYYDKSMFAEARKCYKSAAVSGIADAQFEIARMLYYGKGGSVQKTEAVKWLFSAANQGHPTAQFELGKLFQLGIVVQTDCSRAYNFYYSAAVSGNHEAMCRLGDLLKDGKGVDQDIFEAAQYYIKAARLNDADAQCNLGDLYMDGLGVEQDYEQAAEWYKRASENGRAYAVEQYLELQDVGIISVPLYVQDPDAQYLIGDDYYHGWTVAVDFTKAFDWLSKAASKGKAEALTQLGDMYIYGIAVTRDSRKAAEYYHRASEMGDDTAQFKLGKLYKTGKGILRNLSTAAEFYQKAASQGNSNAMIELGDMYLDGRGVENDTDKAAELYQMAAERGSALAFEKLKNLRYRGATSRIPEIDSNVAQYRIGEEYQYGVGVKQNYKNAVEWYSKAAKTEHDDAQRALGDMYFFGWGVNQNFRKASEWYQKAANLGNYVAMDQLGEMYENGWGVDIDLNRAAALYQQAVDNDCPEAMVHLGNMYEYGSEYYKARVLYEMAARKGNGDALEKLREYEEYDNINNQSENESRIGFFDKLWNR